ncbi:FecR family protein [Chenggangzhangella methanolivorans]|nr:FecR domain-containing protein [Chenggangzhangella methanolivorans]
MAACLAVIVWRDPGLIARARADHATPPGESLSVALEDGSSLFLDADSAVSERFSNGRREVELLRGRAWFDVAPDPTRPFLVHARDIDVRVTGTAFGVDRDRGVVTVENGSVSVAEGGEHLRLTPGQQVASRDGRLLAPEAVDPSTALAWRRGLLVLDAAPLEDVFREIARMAGGRVIAPQAEVRALRLSGVFRAEDPQALIEALRSGLGLRTASAPGLATLVYR